MYRFMFLLCAVLTVSACQTINDRESLYEQLGGQQGIEKVADRFVRLIIKDSRTESHFKETNLDRFFEKLVEQFCVVSGGPCTYTGDEMLSVHKGMNITEGEFNATVEILQQAMNDNHISLSAQNQLLSLLAPMRADMIYK